MNRAVLLVGGLLALLLTAAWWFLLVSPVNQRVTDAEDQLLQAEDEELALRAQQASLQRVEDNMLEYLAAIGELENSIPASPQTAALIDDLSVLADETGVGWTAGSYGQPQAVDGGYFEIPLSISIEGQFFEVLGYLYGMAELDRLVRVDSVNVAPSQDEQGFTVLNVAISARAFTSSDVLLPGIDDVPPEVEPPPEEGDEGDGGGEGEAAGDPDDGDTVAGDAVADDPATDEPAAGDATPDETGGADETGGEEPAAGEGGADEPTDDGAAAGDSGAGADGEARVVMRVVF